MFDQVQSIVVLTGAGISAESGLPTFRASDGLWHDHRVEDVATPEAFVRNPTLVQDFYNQRRRQLLESNVQPNPGHLALADLESRFSGSFLLVTQNIDDLHERAGSQNVRHMHGELLHARCTSCQSVVETHDDLSESSCCGSCGVTGRLRPDIVWFGEIPMHLDEIATALQECDLFVSIGTSGNVYPAAGFVELANSVGAHSWELNLEPSNRQSAFRHHRYGPASTVVPEFVAELLGDSQASDA